MRSANASRARSFFLSVLKPIEKTRSAALTNLAQLKLSNQSLKKRTIELLEANKILKIEVAQRKRAEKALKISERECLAMLEEAHEMQRRLRRLSHQILLAQEEERRVISRELHDEIVQTLTGINVQLATLNLEAGANKKSFSKHIQHTQRLVEKSVDIVHRFARELRPTVLDDLGLIPALHAYLKAFRQRTGLRVRLAIFSGVEKMSNDNRTVLYRVAQAALINVAEHAEASEVSVSIQPLQGEVMMEVKDDGKSFDTKRALDSRHNKRLGLLGMRERVEMVGGTFGLVSMPGHGTTISARIPFKIDSVKSIHETN